MLIKAVFEEKSISKAGTRLALSQSALSKTLSKLRYLFEDDLFLRVGNEMQPTPKAAEVYAQAQDILRRMNDLFTSSGFDPEKDEYRFSIICNEMMSESIFPIILRKIGPKGSLALRGEGAEPQYADAATDFIFEVTDGRRPRMEEEKGRIVVPIGNLSHKIIVRSRHPILSRSSIRFQELAHYPKISASFLPSLWSSHPDFMHYLGEHNHRASIISTPSMATALECVRKSDGVLIAPVFSRIAKSRPDLEIIRTTRLSHQISPAAFSLSYSAILRSSRAHIWFVQTVLESIKESLAAEEIDISST